jgi:Chaperone of endosialidase
MAKKGGSPPPPPDPVATARAQTGSNVATATANSVLGNAEEVSPLGRVTKSVHDPSTGSTYQVPRWKRETILSPEQQRLYDQQTQLGGKMNDLAINQTDRINTLLSTPLSLDGLPDAPGDSEGYRREVEDAMYARLNPQLDRDRAALENRLVTQGLARGSEQFNEAMSEHGRNVNDARNQVLLASGAEARSQGAHQATNRERSMQERLTERNQPINEITALMGGGQVSMPQFTPFRGSQMSETPIGQYMFQSAQMGQDAWKAQQQAAAQERAGLYQGLGSMAGGLFKLSDRRLKRDIVRLGTLPSGLPLYAFRYVWSDDLHTGVMAQEVEQVIPAAVVTLPGGIKAVDYRKVM